MRKEKPNCDYSQKWKKTNKLTFFKKRSCQENIWNIQSWDFCTIKINTNSHPHIYTHSLTLVVIVCVSLRASGPLVPWITIVWSFFLSHPHTHTFHHRGHSFWIALANADWRFRTCAAARLFSSFYFVEKVPRDERVRSCRNVSKGRSTKSLTIHAHSR